jgi:hypothetical protein
MSQLNTPVRRSGGEPDVYTALLGAAALALLLGIAALFFANTSHSKAGNQEGGPFAIVE